MKNKDKIQVTQSSLPSFEEYAQEIKSIFESKWLTNMGEKHRILESQLKDYLGVEQVTLFTNGHLALEAILQAMDLHGEVITTPYTFASTTHAIVRSGLTPVFCDIDPVDYTIDASKIESLITEKTVAIMPVHVYGNICDVDTIQVIAKKHGLKVIYDAAHTFGVRVNGVGVGSFGDASMFSFHATKVFNTIEGGALTYHDSSLGPILNHIKNFGISGPETVELAGGNAKMNEFQAAMGICNLRHIDAEISKRKVVAKHYDSHLRNIKGIKLSQTKPNITSNFAYYPVVFDGFIKSRDEIYEELIQNDIITRKYFYPLTNDFDCYKGTFDAQPTPIARYIADRVLTLPLYADLPLDVVDRICKIIKE